ncbi:hypothetical protein SAMN05421736_103278 [Evansella caseinilytica]|uniref:Uncharacterized protein n=1 Tax=Evansella caseinilytica TaxID=1503961 RepID=A0A1H3MM27_9BACI|nr:DUF5665 domain-containing protein [Evansella caseinilytica]SDY77781.1 hypothetical protein SAMN05421736_103278 [Evansella caseinilytica]
MNHERDTKELERLLKELQTYTRSLEKAEQLDRRLEKISWALEKSKINDVLLNYTNPKRVFFINILVGIGRGLGLTIGTVIVLSLLGLLLRQFVDVPLIGEWISNILDYVEMNQNSPS